MLSVPVVALLAKLLLEVAQGETVALHAPPVGDLLVAEEIRHHRLAAAAAATPSVAPCHFSHPERRTDGEVERAGTSDKQRNQDQRLKTAERKRTAAELRRRNKKQQEVSE